MKAWAKLFVAGSAWSLVCVLLVLVLQVTSHEDVAFVVWCIGMVGATVALASTAVVWRRSRGR